ncbi:MAG TPA: maleylpyruvate isomerase N-terminal domain-containing protein [Ktedonobacterales bacterium]
MGDKQDTATRLLERIETAWAAFNASYAGLAAAELAEPGVAGEWSVKDILAHITTWEGEALKYLPVIIAGGTPPRYATEGGLDAFNARMAQQKRGLALAEVRRQLRDTHQRLIAYIEAAPPEQFAHESRARRRLRLDTYGHYPEHSRMIQEWRVRRKG